MIDILNPLLSDIFKAGEMIYDKYRKDVKISRNDDGTFVTNVNRIVHDELSQSLNKLFPGVPIISKEGDMPDFNDRKDLSHYWLLDPLDGTQSFVEESDQFVISLGLIQDNNPIMGVLHHPVSGRSWVSVNNRGVFIQEHGGDILPVQQRRGTDEYIILVSANEEGSELCQMIVRQREKEVGKAVTVASVESALKFGYLIDGIGDEYISFNDTEDWDFAAGHSIAIEAGFKVVPLDQADHIIYGTKDMKIPPISIRKK